MKKCLNAALSFRDSAPTDGFRQRLRSKTGAAHLALPSVLRYREDLAGRQSVTCQVQRELVVMEVRGVYIFRIENVLDQNPCVKVIPHAAAVTDLAEYHDLFRQNYFDL